jgi:hypothetical protein
LSKKECIASEERNETEIKNVTNETNETNVKNETEVTNVTNETEVTNVTNETFSLSFGATKQDLGCSSIFQSK